MVEDKDRKTYWSYILENLHATVQNWKLIYLELEGIALKVTEQGVIWLLLYGKKINMTPWYRVDSLEMVNGRLSGDVTVISVVATKAWTRLVTGGTVKDEGIRDTQSAMSWLWW